ncbi:MAG: peptide chain release factor N(5)-glutamine methyltransferase [Polynucleobacter victoriensis]
MPSISELLQTTALDKVDAKVLLANLIEKHLGWPKSSLISRDRNSLPQALVDDWLDLEKKRLLGHPIAYLTGKREFFNIELTVGPGVLIPRPETELLVELVIDFLDLAKGCQISAPKVLDLGTGSGAIGLAIAKNIPSALVTCVDISTDALAIAKRNAELLNLKTVQFHQGSWFDGIAHKFDVIVSNPPYIPRGDQHLSMGDLRFEPSSALTDDQDGLSAYCQIFQQAPSHLNAGGLILVEHGYDQSEAVCQLLTDCKFVDIKAHLDLAGIKRAASAKLG